MRKFILSVIVISLIGIVSYGVTLYNTNYSGTTYYVKITNEGFKTSDSGYTRFVYTLDSINAAGETKTLEFNANRDNPLKIGGYLELVVNDLKGVISWQEIAEEDLPDLVLEYLNK